MTYISIFGNYYTFGQLNNYNVESNLNLQLVIINYIQSQMVDYTLNLPALACKHEQNVEY